jgi:hypothetical protein
MRRHAAVYVMVVADALELALPAPGRYPLEHAGEQREVLLLAERERRDFQASLGAGQAWLQSVARSLALPLQCIDTAVDPVDAVATLLRTRGGRR